MFNVSDINLDRRTFAKLENKLRSISSEAQQYTILHMIFIKKHLQYQEFLLLVL